MGVYTAQNAMGFARVERWGHWWKLSDWALYMLGNNKGYLYGPLEGGFLVVPEGRELLDNDVIQGVYFLKSFSNYFEADQCFFP